MKTRVQKFQAKGFYCLQGNACANCLFFEDAEDQKLFINLFNRFLGEMLELYFYSTNATGWTLCFKTKERSEIQGAYRKLKEKRKKDNSLDQGIEVGQMLSEHFRFFLSAYVKQSNFRHKRHGVRVHSKMEKYIFECMEDMEFEIDKMKMLRGRKLQYPKYRPKMRYYLVDKQLNRESVLRQSLVGIGGGELIQTAIPCFKEIVDKVQLLRELISNTWNLHFGPKIDPFPPPLLE